MTEQPLAFDSSDDLDSGFRGAIVAMTKDQVIGVDGDMPWHYSADLKRFRQLTTGTSIIMGRLTWLAIGAKALPRRRNIVISRTQQCGVDTYQDLDSAIASVEGPLWFIGGAKIYQSALPYCQLIDVVYVPDIIDIEQAVRFPMLDEEVWEQSALVPFDDDPRLTRCQFKRKDT